MKLIKKVVLLWALLFTAPVVAAPSDFLVTTDWLEKNLNNPKLRLIEVSVDTGVYERGHIQGAVNFKWHTDLVDPVKRDIASKENFEKLLRQAGVNNDSTIVIYGDSNNWFAAWGAWVFDVYGVKNVKLLDGGRKKWEAEKRPLTPLATQVAAGNVKVSDANNALRARLIDVVAIANKKSDTALVDIRSPDEFTGKIFAPAGVQETAIRAGHIPGAVNVPWGQAVAEDGTFKSPEELKKVYAAVGIDGKKPIITYCRIGERSSHTWFALSKILGYNVKNYDGSWTEYGNSVGNPVINTAGTIKVSDANNALRARLIDVVAIANKKSDTALVDIRSPDEFTGKIFAPAGVQETAIRAGHIPGAVNVPWGQAVAEDGTFKSPEELKKVYAAVGIDGKKPIITYCRIGERSSHTWFALSKILGYNVKNYDGSWTEYGNSVGNPVINTAGTIWGGK